MAFALLVLSPSLGAGLALRAVAEGKPGTDLNPQASNLGGERSRSQSTETSAKAASGTGDVSKSKAAKVDLGIRPYKIRAWVVADPTARLDASGRAELISAWLSLVARFVGPPWELEVAEGPGPLLGGDLTTLQADTVAAAVPGFDKAWPIKIEPDGGDGFLLSGREFDAATLRLGQVIRRRVAYPSDAARGLLNLALEMFSPFAEIGEVVGGAVKITVQGAGLTAADPIGRVVAPGTAFRLVRLNYDLKGVAGGVIARSKSTGQPLIKDVPHSFLRVLEVDGAGARCAVVSGVKDPLTKRALRSKVVALGIKPAGVPMRLRFVIPPERRDPSERREAVPPRPAAGFVLTARRIPDGPPRDLGTTDREGRITLPPLFDDRLVVLRLMAGGSEPLVEFPAMPGESPFEQVIPLRPKPEAVALETSLNAFRDELVDQVGIRNRLKTLIEKRIDAAQPDEAKAMLDQYRKLPTRKDYEARLAGMRAKAAEEQRALKRPILTRTAQASLADVESLVSHYINDDVLGDLETAFKEQNSKAKAPAKPANAKEAAIAKATVEAEAEAKARAAGPPPPAPAPPPSETQLAAEQKNGLSDFAPAGLGFRVAMPGVPQETQQETGTPFGPAKSLTFLLADPERGDFQVSYLRFPKIVRMSNIQVALDQGRDLALAKYPGSRVLGERTFQVAEVDSRDVEIQLPEVGKQKRAAVVRVFILGRGIYLASVTGAPEAVHARIAQVFLNSMTVTPEGPAP